MALNTRHGRGLRLLALIPHRDVRNRLRSYSEALFAAGIPGAWAFPWVVPLACLSRPLSAAELQEAAAALREANSGGDGMIHSHGTAFLSLPAFRSLAGPGRAPPADVAGPGRCSAPPADVADVAGPGRCDAQPADVAEPGRCSAPPADVADAADVAEPGRCSAPPADAADVAEPGRCSAQPADAADAADAAGPVYPAVYGLGLDLVFPGLSGSAATALLCPLGPPVLGAALIEGPAEAAALRGGPGRCGTPPANAAGPGRCSAQPADVAEPGRCAAPPANAADAAGRAGPLPSPPEIAFRAAALVNMVYLSRGASLFLWKTGSPRWLPAMRGAAKRGGDA